MTERKGDVREPAPAGPELVVHKPTRACPMQEPHPRELCGIVQARERNREAADAARRRSRGT